MISMTHLCDCTHTIRRGIVWFLILKVGSGMNCLVVSPLHRFDSLNLKTFHSFGVVVENQRSWMARQSARSTTSQECICTPQMQLPRNCIGKAFFNANRQLEALSCYGNNDTARPYHEGGQYVLSHATQPNHRKLVLTVVRLPCTGNGAPENQSMEAI